MDFAAEQKADFLIRGIRGTSDVDSEYALNCFNKTFNAGLETVFLMPPPQSDDDFQHVRVGSSQGGKARQSVGKPLC